MDTFKNLKKVMTNTLKMLKARGYNTLPYEKYLTEEKLIELYHKDNFELIIQPLKKCINYLNIIHVRFSVHCKPSYDDIKTIVSDLISTDSDNESESESDITEDNAHDILLIYSVPGKTCKFRHNKVQILEYKELLFNKIDHIFVPKHELLRNSQEIQTLIDYYKVPNKYRFPLMCKNDPISKYYNAKKGDMFKITRNGKNGESIIYRCVV
jgi:DNA-directed RNA polymerase subunit H (RpoH/RPB5)